MNTERLRYAQMCHKFLCLPVWIFTRNNLDVNWSLTVKRWSDSMSLVLGSFDSTRWVILPRANDCRDLAKSLSGMSVSCLISWQCYTICIMYSSHCCSLPAGRLSTTAKTVSCGGNHTEWLSEWVGFNVPINTLYVISEMSLSSQSIVLVLSI